MENNTEKLANTIFEINFYKKETDGRDYVKAYGRGYLVFGNRTRDTV